MSLNKFSAVSTGYDLRLDVGCDELKCNTLEIAGNPLESGSYNPVIVPAAATLIADPALNNAFYTKIGNVLTIHGKMAIDVWNANGNFTVSLPVGYSAAASGPQYVTAMGTGTSAAGGIVGFDNGMTDTENFEIRFVQTNGSALPGGSSAGLVKYSVSVECD